MDPIICISTGEWVNLLKLEDRHLEIEIIAHSLAQLNRFNGHSKRPITVAQHSVFASRLCSPENALQGLLHDAAEAYTGDMTKWLKGMPWMEEYRKLQDRIQRQIYKKYGCSIKDHEEVKTADRLLVRFEGMMGYGNDWIINHPRYPRLTRTEIDSVGPWGFWQWRESKQIFLDTFRMLNEA